MEPLAARAEVDALAIFGGPPLFEEPLHVGRPNIGDRAKFDALMKGVLDRAWLTNDGPLAREFEAEVAARSGVRHCVAMCNGTIALEIAIRALGLTGEVIVPSFTFVATAHALQWQEITPVFADVRSDNHTLDVDAVAAMITPRTTGILAVHLWGFPAAVSQLQQLADEHGLALLFDAAHAFGCAAAGRPIGGFGRAEVLSFHATKFLNSFEGGAVVTDDDELAEQMRLMRNFGFAGYDNVIYIGTNGKLTEPCAAMGIANLGSIDSFVAANRRNYDTYRRGLADLPGIRVLGPRDEDEWNHQYVVLEVAADDAHLTRDELVAVLHAENVLARRYFTPGVHRMEPYRSYFPHAGLLLPTTLRLVDQVLALPTGTAIGPGAIAQVCEVIVAALEQAPRVRAAVAAVSA